jgi:hypothetical protein
MTEFQVPVAGQLNPKAAHLIVLKEKIGVAKNAHNRCFVSLEQPVMAGVSFVQSKGFYSDEPQEVIAEKYREMITTVNKDLIEDLYIPWHEIAKVKSLVYKAK